LLPRCKIEDKQSEKEAKEKSMRDPSMNQEKSGWIDAIDPGYEDIQVGCDPAQHQGRKEPFIKSEIAAQQVGQQCVGEEVHSAIP